MLLNNITKGLIIVILKTHPNVFCMIENEAHIGCHVIAPS